MNAQIAEINEMDFELEVLQSKLPAMVAFLAPWSRCCHVISPVLDEVATACVGNVKVVKVNVDDNPDLGMWYGIQFIPTLLCFVDGEVRAKIPGTASKETILTKLKVVAEAIPSIQEPIPKVENTNPTERKI
ncbi:MAG: thioredoxin [Pedosphaera sp.]|jgi:thioredoxin 1|nr:thioredoxin [Pedosphaera sp.]